MQSFPIEKTGPRLNIKTVFPRYGIPMWKIRRSVYIETAPWFVYPPLAILWCWLTSPKYSCLSITWRNLKAHYTVFFNMLWFLTNRQRLLSLWNQKLSSLLHCNISKPRPLSINVNRKKQTNIWLQCKYSNTENFWKSLHRDLTQIMSHIYLKGQWSSDCVCPTIWHVTKSVDTAGLSLSAILRKIATRWHQYIDLPCPPKSYYILSGLKLILMTTTVNF